MRKMALVSALVGMIAVAPPAAHAADALRQCDVLAASPLDATRPKGVNGVGFGKLDAGAAVAACEAAVKAKPDDARANFNLGRALQAEGKDLDRARSFYEKAGGKGHGLALFNLGVMYRDAIGGPRDYGRALDYFRKADAAHYAGAANEVGQAYRNGRGVKQDDAEAFKWYDKAAKMGDATALANLGQMYEDGLGVAADQAKAVDYYKKSAAKGDGMGLLNLGWDYEQGKGVPKDDAIATSYYKKAAEAGNADGFNNYGVNLANGIGTLKDLKAAEAMLIKGVEAGSDRAAYNLAFDYNDGKFGQPDPAKAAHYALVAIAMHSALAETVLYEGRGKKLSIATLEALQGLLAEKGLKFDKEGGQLSNSAIEALKKYAASQP
ncbi:MAG: sel1 repeat family protein [Alphaproteobacteria bacterium]|nr:sel1 repeat family protein [Alphaproteobacteria bacterium]